MTENEIGKVIVDSAIEVHRELGGLGLLEGVYEEAINFGEQFVKNGVEDRRKT